ncbi:hypothetical protein BC567DRAFT_24230 [Phyllosticta citribraziliensis]
MALIDDVSIQPEPEDGDNFLQIKSGTLTIRGYLFSVELNPDRAQHRDNTRFKFDNLDPDPGRERKGLPPKKHVFWDRSYCGECCNGDICPDLCSSTFHPDFLFQQHCSDHSVHCLLTFREEPETDTYYDDYFLVLRHKKDQRVFERVGIVRVSSLRSF